MEVPGDATPLMRMLLVNVIKQITRVSQGALAYAFAEALIQGKDSGDETRKDLRVFADVAGEDGYRGLEERDGGMHRVFWPYSAFRPRLTDCPCEQLVAVIDPDVPGKGARDDVRDDLRAVLHSLTEAAWLPAKRVLALAECPCICF